MLIHHRNRWDAQTYDQVSRLVQYRWGQEVLEWRNWKGDETVMDAGCGSGLLTRLLALKVPKGKIYGVDIDSNMIKQAKRNLKDLENVELVLSDFSNVKIPTKLDVIFSNASLHWVHNHAKVFRHFWNMLKSKSDNRRQLLIQCGGYGNLKRTLLLMRQVMKSNEFKGYFTNINQPWYFPKPDETIKLLRKIGYVNNKVHLHNAHVTMNNRKVYSRFVKTVIMKPFLESLPYDKLRKRYLHSFLYEVEKKGVNRSQNIWSLDYVRLNIIADRR